MKYSLSFLSAALVEMSAMVMSDRVEVGLKNVGSNRGLMLAQGRALVTRFLAGIKSSPGLCPGLRCPVIPARSAGVPLYELESGTLLRAARKGRAQREAK